MSQKKMEAYKEAKKNKRQIEKKQKRNKILGWIFGILVTAALIAGCVFLVYYTNVLLPRRQAEENKASQAAEDIVDYLNSENADDAADGADVSDEGGSDTADDADASNDGSDTAAGDAEASDDNADAAAGDVETDGAEDAE